MPSSLNRRQFLQRSAAALGACGLSRAALAAAEPARPNFLFVFADDLAFDNIGALGCPEAFTPNLDRLAQQGVSFDHCYNQGGWHGAICIASRTMLLTGRFLWEARALDPHVQQECDAGRLWPQHLEQAGYRTYMSGKWHVNCDASRVFQVARNIRPGMPPDVPEQYNRPLENEPDPFDPSDPALGGFFSGGTHWSETLGDDAVAFLQDASEHDAPFFMYLAFNAPHDPRQSPREYLERHPLEKMRVPDNFLPEYPYKDDIGCGPGLRDERLAPFPRTEHAIRTQRREYHAIISHMDAQIGRILDALEKSGKAESTYILFTADHGLAVGRHGFMGKQNMYEHSMKAPLIVTGPDIPAGTRVQAPVYLQDVVPTTLALAGVDAPGYVQYKNLMPLIQGTRDTQYDAIYGAYMSAQRMARAGRYKIIHYPKLDRYRLYDLEADPLEKNDLAGEPAHAERLEQLKEQLSRIQRDMGDPLVKQEQPSTSPE